MLLKINKLWLYYSKLIIKNQQSYLGIKTSVNQKLTPFLRYEYV